jgi:hypothetical protein
MLTNEDNELITRVGPGAMMGELLRQYWIPGLPSRELPERDGRPKRVLLPEGANWVDATAAARGAGAGVPISAVPLIAG